MLFADLCRCSTSDPLAQNFDDKAIHVAFMDEDDSFPNDRFSSDSCFQGDVQLTQFRITLPSGTYLDFLAESRPSFADFAPDFPDVLHHCGRLLRINPCVLRLIRARDDEYFNWPETPVPFGITH